MNDYGFVVARNEEDALRKFYVGENVHDDPDEARSEAFAGEGVFKVSITASKVA